ncbi:MAG: SDR family NAD(P)-dependent oxidoreductase [Pseudomonadota bacterium]
MLNFKQNLKVVVVGASGGIGSAFIHHLVNEPNVEKIYALSRAHTSFDSDKVHSYQMNLIDEDAVEKMAETLKNEGGVDAIIVATGMLHDDTIKPEKSLRDIQTSNFEKVMAVNTIGPALIMRHFLPLLPREGKSIFAALSARVGSISDNHIGGWYAYRASKAALNMLIKNASIEFGRRYKEAVIVGLHPGTVDTGLSEPFQGNVPEHKLFTPEYSTEHMLKVLNTLNADQSGKCFDYAGEEIEA